MSSSTKNSDEIKKIESESWKKSDFGVKPTSIKDVYNETWNDFLLKKSIKNVGLNGKSVINVGGGPGNEAEFLIRNGAKKVLLIDIAPGQLETADLRRKKHSLNNLELELSDAENLKHDNKSFDIGYIYMALHHFPDHYKSISEICRVSKEVIFVDIPNAKLTKFLNLFGLFKEEWCGIEPNRLKETEVKKILDEQGMDMKIEYFFFPPLPSENRAIVFLTKLISKLINFTMKIRFSNLLFGNVCLIKGKKKQIDKRCT